MTNGVEFEQESEAMVLAYASRPRPDLRDLITVRYATLVERVARRYSGIEHFDDLSQVGYIGLLNALEKFDPDAGVKFKTYATHLVAGEIKHYLRDRAQTIRQPAWLQELRSKVRRAAGDLQTELKRAPSHREIAESLGVSESSVSEAISTQDLLKLHSLDYGHEDDEDELEIDRLDASDFCPEQLSIEESQLLERSIRQLREIEQEVLVKYHFDGMNQSEIAGELDISCNYVSHILRQSMSKLRRILADEDRSDAALLRSHSPSDATAFDHEIGVYSSTYFKSRLAEEIHRASANRGEVSLVLIEFEGLRSLAGFYGDASVRDFLVDSAEFLTNAVRRLDIVCRFEQNGFGIILPATGVGSAVVRSRLIDRMGDWVRSRVHTGGPLRVGVGHATMPLDAGSVASLVSCARERMDFGPERVIEAEGTLPEAA